MRYLFYAFLECRQINLVKCSVIDIYISDVTVAFLVVQSEMLEADSHAVFWTS